MGRPPSANPKRNIISVKLSDNELMYIDELAKVLGKGRSTIIRELLNLLFKIDPEKLKKNWNNLELNFGNTEI